MRIRPAEEESEEQEGQSLSEVRVDKWLWAARCFKTRTQASDAAAGGHVKVNQQPAHAAKLVRVGDEVEVLTPGGRKILKILGLGERRGAAEVARGLYEDRTPAPPPNQPRIDVERGGGRPTKKDRRTMDRLRLW